MTKRNYYFLLLGALPLLSSCEAIGAIFKAGMWWAFILIFGVVGLVLWLFSRGRK